MLLVTLDFWQSCGIISLMNSTPFINRSAVKRLALDYAKANRAGRFTRVSKDFFQRIDARVRVMITDEVQRHPSIGKTLK